MPKLNFHELKKLQNSSENSYKTTCLLLVSGRVVNVYVPIYYKLIVNSLARAYAMETLVFRYDLVLVYCGLRSLQLGLLQSFHSIMWIGVQQYTTRGVQVPLMG